MSFYILTYRWVVYIIIYFYLFYSYIFPLFFRFWAVHQIKLTISSAFELT